MTQQCESNIKDRLGAYHDGELSETEAAEVEAHVRQCPPCAQELKQLRRLSLVLGRIELPEPSQQLMARLHDAVESEGEDVLVLRFVRRVTSVAAAVLIAGAVWLVAAQQSTTPGTTIATGTMDWETVATTPPSAAVEYASATVQQGSVEEFAQWIVNDLQKK